MVQWLNICCAMQGTWVLSLVRELRSHKLQSWTEPTCHNYRIRELHGWNILPAATKAWQPNKYVNKRCFWKVFLRAVCGMDWKREREERSGRCDRMWLKWGGGHRYRGSVESPGCQHATGAVWPLVLSSLLAFSSPLSCTNPECFLMAVSCFFALNMLSLQEG